MDELVKFFAECNPHEQVMLEAMLVTQVAHWRAVKGLFEAFLRTTYVAPKENVQ
jgi:hypothetical protein